MVLVLAIVDLLGRCGQAFVYQRFVPDCRFGSVVAQDLSASREPFLPPAANSRQSTVTHLAGRARREW